MSRSPFFILSAALLMTALAACGNGHAPPTTADIQPLLNDQINAITASYAAQGGTPAQFDALELTNVMIDPSMGNRAYDMYRMHAALNFSLLNSDGVRPVTKDYIVVVDRNGKGGSWEVFSIVDGE